MVIENVNVDSLVWLFVPGPLFFCFVFVHSSVRAACVSFLEDKTPQSHGHIIDEVLLRSRTDARSSAKSPHFLQPLESVAITSVTVNTDP